MIVVDVGCAPHGPERSIEKLIARFEPDAFYGFDPQSWRHGVTFRPSADVKVFPALAQIEAKAAWTHDGTIEFAQAGIDGTVMRDKNTRGEWDAETREVPCFDLAAFIRGLPAGDVVLKLDCEGAEVPLLEHLHATGMDERLTLLLVEWHDEVMNGDYGARRVVLEQSLRCPVEEWA